MARLAKLWHGPASALLLLLAFAPFNLTLLVFVALVPWLLRLRELTGRAAFRSGYGFGLVFMLGQMYFLQPFVSRWTGSFFIGVVPWILTAIVGALYFGLVGWLMALCWKRQIAWAIPLVWAGVEVFRSYVPPFAFPWGLIATPLWVFPEIIQHAYYGTIFLVGAWVVLPNLVIAQLMAGEGILRARPAVFAFVALLAVSLARFGQETQGDVVPVLIGQPGTDLAFGDPAENQIQIARSVQRFYMTGRLGGAQLLLLPEGVTLGGAGLPPPTPFQVEEDVPIVFGGQRGADPAVYQTAFAYDGEWSFADKTRLVIFGEFVPGRDWIPFLSLFNLPGGDLTAGERVTALDVDGIRLGPVICFEALFPDIAYRQALNGARMLAVMSVDDWYMGSNAPDQLRAAAIWRAVETGLPLARSATLGYTLALDDKGRFITQAPLGASTAIRAEMSLPLNPRPFPGLPLFPVFALAFGPAVWVLDVVRRRRE